MGKSCLFSAVRAVVLDNGRPVSGAAVERTFKWGWNDETGHDSAVTGADGSVSFVPIWRSSMLASILPHEPFIDQRISIQYEGRSYDAWIAEKREYAENGELNGAPIDLVCELRAPREESKLFTGICHLRETGKR